MQRDLRETPLYQEVEAAYRRLAEPGFGRVTQATDVRASPDGSAVAFRGARLDALEGHPSGRICLAAADGSGMRQVTQGPNDDSGPRWSPDGTTLTFLSDRATAGSAQVYALETGVLGEARPLAEAPGIVEHHEWSPDGSRIAFTSDRGASSQIFVMGSDGSGQTGITSAGTSFGPQWSPDGSRIAFLTSMAAPPEVWTVNPDGTNPIQLTNEPSDGKADLRWSSDGRKIVYTFAYRPSDIGGLGSDIWTMNADGSGKVNVTNNKLDNTSPVWSPDGSQIAFVFGFGTGANAEVRVVSADGSGPQRNVSTRQGYRPDW